MTKQATILYSGFLYPALFLIKFLCPDVKFEVIIFQRVLPLSQFLLYISFTSYRLSPTYVHLLKNNFQIYLPRSKHQRPNKIVHFLSSPFNSLLGTLH